MTGEEKSYTFIQVGLTGADVLDGQEEKAIRQCLEMEIEHFFSLSCWEVTRDERWVAELSEVAN